MKLAFHGQSDINHDMVRGLLNYYNINKVFILGAGFSAPLGMPLTNNILSHIHKISSKKNWFDDGGLVPYGQAAWLLERLQFFYPTYEWKHERIANSDHAPKDFDIEEFLSYACASSAFGEQWDEHGDKFISFLKGWIAEAIFKSQKKHLSGNIPPQYLNFIESLEESLVLTFNWDTVVETLLEQAEKPYIFDFSSRVSQPNSIPIIKYHGSIDWFSNLHDFRKKDWMNFTPISQNLEGFYRAHGDLSNYYDSHIKPMIIVPSYDKISQVAKLGRLWESPWIFLQDKLEVVIIGFSMRPDDFHSRAVIYPQLVQGSRNGDLKIKVIDYADSDDQKDEIRLRYEGVENCSFWFDGFNQDAMNFINS